MKTTIRIAPLDAALVIRADGSLESWLPHLHENVPDSAMAASALMCAYFDGEIREMLLEALRARGYEYPGPPLNAVPGPPPH